MVGGGSGGNRFGATSDGNRFGGTSTGGGFGLAVALRCAGEEISPRGELATDARADAARCGATLAPPAVIGST